MHVKEAYLSDHLHSLNSCAALNLMDDLTHCLSRPDYQFKLDNGLPPHTSAWIFDQIVDKLVEIQNANCPAAAIQAFASGATGTRFPSQDQWIKAYTAEVETSLIFKIISNPALAVKKNNMKVDSIHSPLHQFRMVFKEDFIILQEPLGM